MTEHVGPGSIPAPPHGRRPTLRVVGGTAATSARSAEETVDERLRAHAAAARAAHPSSGAGVPGFRRPQPAGESAHGDRPAGGPRDGVRSVDGSGPHLVTAPVFLAAARPGDVLKVEVLSLQKDGGPCEPLEPGCTAYLPVRTDGALFCPRELHRTMGLADPGAGDDSLHGSFRLTVCRPGAQDVPSAAQRQPLAETGEHWIVVGRSATGGPDDERTFCLTTAMQRAVSAGVDFLERDRGMDKPIAHAYLSATAQFAVTRLEDGSVGAHGRICKADFN